jgi:hypothetical protein
MCVQCGLSILSDVHKLLVFRKMFGRKRDETSRQFSVLNEEELFIQVTMYL